MDSPTTEALHGPADVGLRLLGDLSPAGNALVSPASLAAALALLMDATTERSREALTEALGVGPPAVVRHAIRDVLESWRLEDEGSGHGLEVAQALFHAPGARFPQGFPARVRDAYAARLIEVDFDSAVQTARAVNRWCDEITRGLVGRIVGPGDVGGAARAVVINATWFAGRWAHPFEASRTELRPFRGEDGTARRVPTMDAIQSLPHAFEPVLGFSAVTLPYRAPGENGRFAMTVILPDPGRLRKVEALLSSAFVRWVLERSSPVRVHLRLPRVEAEAELTLLDALSGTGVYPFGAVGRAELAVSTASGDSLYVDQVRHAARMVVDEEGTEAAAVTSVMVSLMADSDSGIPVPFFVDRPHLLLLHDRRTGVVLFAARIVDPVPPAGEPS